MAVKNITDLLKYSKLKKKIEKEYKLRYKTAAKGGTSLLMAKNVLNTNKVTPNSKVKLSKVGNKHKKNKRNKSRKKYSTKTELNT